VAQDRTVEEPGRRRRLEQPATVAHLITLAVGGAWLVWLGRTHWFVADEWEFITNRGLSHPALGLFQPHMQHWVTGPIIVYRVLLNLFGLQSYMPYLVTGVAVHLIVVHLAWRVAVRSGADRWVATGLAALLLIASPTAPNGWAAFQITLDGSVAFGLALLLLVDRREPLGMARATFTAVLAVVSLTFSAVSVPLVAMAGALLLFRRGWKVTLGVFAPSGIAFAIWYEAVGRESISQGGGSVQLTGSALRDLPSFVWHGLAHAVGDPLRLRGFVATAALVVLVAATAALLVFARRDRAAIAYTGALGAILFFAVTSLGRANFGPTASRYLYVASALLLPLVALAIGFVWSHGYAARVALALALALVLGLNARDLRRTALAEGAADQDLRHQILAVARVVREHQPVPGGVVPQIAVNPDLTVAKMRALIRAGWFPSERVDAAAYPWASVYPRLDVSSKPSSRSGEHAPTVVPVAGAPSVHLGCADVANAPAGRLVVRTDGPASVQLRSTGLTQVQVWQTDAAGNARGMVLVAVLPPGRIVYLNMRRADTNVIVPYYGGFTACGLAGPEPSP
jgi:hypothetical protein